MKQPMATSAVSVLATLLLLAGCASPSAYDSKAQTDLQARVLAVTEAVGAGDFLAADAGLSELTGAANDALAKGQVSTEQHDSIIAAAALVQTDVDAAIAAAEAAAAAEAEKLRLAAEEAARQAAEDNDIDDDDKENGKGKKDG